MEKITFEAILRGVNAEDLVSIVEFLPITKAGKVTIEKMIIHRDNEVHWIISFENYPTLREWADNFVRAYQKEMYFPILQFQNIVSRIEAQLLINIFDRPIFTITPNTAYFF